MRVLPFVPSQWRSLRQQPLPFVPYPLRPNPTIPATKVVVIPTKKAA